MENEETQKIIEQRKKKVIDYFKQGKNWIYYLILALIVGFGVWIRTLNISKLKDVTTGGWALGPDLDPYLFLRWAQYIVAHGKLMVMDVMRYVPLGYDTSGEMKLLSYMIAWFHYLLSWLGISHDVTYSAILFPAIMFGFTSIAFFLFARKVFYKQENYMKNLIALASTLLFVLVPSLLPRTIAGIPEKESVAFGFMFLALYFFLEAFTREKFRTKIIFGLLAGITTALMALTWGGVIFVFFTIPVSVLVYFFFGKINKKNTTVYFIWVVSSILIMMAFSSRYTFTTLLTSLSTMLAIGVLFILIIYIIVKNQNFVKKIKEKTKLPIEIITILLSIILLIILASIFFGLGFIPDQITHTVQSLIHPISSSRQALTVAENKQPYFIDWRSNFGPSIKNIPLFFWLFFIGAVLLFYELIKKLPRKEKIYLTTGYLIFLIGLIFSRYSPSSTLNGENGSSILLYFISVVIFGGCIIYFYYKLSKENKLEILKEFNFEYVLYFVLLTLAIIAARSGIRLVMALGAVAPVAIGFLVVKSIQKSFKEKEDSGKIIFWVIAILIFVSFIFTIWIYYHEVKATSENFAPSLYNWQWQEAMAWVRNNTSENAVFTHWWDYGYWVQSIGQRATVLDGGNGVNYWNYLMGRYVLTEPSKVNSLEFLYSHNVTHLLIDSTDIGKYSAFASIGSDENYDRFSWIQTFLMNEQSTQERENQTIYVYNGQSAVDQDFVWKENNSEIFIPAKSSAVIGIFLIKGIDGKFLQPQAVFYVNGKQINIPLRYLYENKNLTEFKSGLEAGIFVFPSVNVNSQNQVGINKDGALLYFSQRTINSNLVRLYLFDEKSQYFNLVHSQDNLIVESLKKQVSSDIGDFVYSGNYCGQTNGLCGPIKIWELKYPEGIKINQTLLLRDFPNPIWNLPKAGEYN